VVKVEIYCESTKYNQDFLMAVIRKWNRKNL